MSENENLRAKAPQDGFGLIEACRRLHAAVDDLDAKTADSIDISRNDLRCLNLLEHGPLTPKALSLSLGLTSGSVTSLLDRLEKRGFIKRLSHPEDRRALLVQLEPRVFGEIGAIYRKFGESIVRLANACETISRDFEKSDRE
jgi:DNA-binding MarR family transcriptional regulator